MTQKRIYIVIKNRHFRKKYKLKETFNKKTDKNNLNDSDTIFRFVT